MDISTIMSSQNQRKILIRFFLLTSLSLQPFLSSQLHQFITCQIWNVTLSDELSCSGRRRVCSYTTALLCLFWLPFIRALDLSSRAEGKVMFDHSSLLCSLHFFSPLNLRCSYSLHFLPVSWESYGVWDMLSIWGSRTLLFVTLPFPGDTAVWSAYSWITWLSSSLVNSSTLHVKNRASSCPFTCGSS